MRKLTAGDENQVRSLRGKYPGEACGPSSFLDPGDVIEIGVKDSETSRSGKRGLIS